MASLPTSSESEHLSRRAAVHVRRGAHCVLRWLAALAAVLILVVLAAIWRLMQGPIELNGLAPYAEAAFSRSGVGLKIAVSGVRLALNRNSHRIDLQAEGVRIGFPDGRPLASFPELTTGFALGALLRGHFSPSQVVVERPELRLVRAATGSIGAQVGGDAGAKSSAGAPELGPSILKELAGPPRPNTPLGLLHEIDIRGATLTIDDRHSGQTWQMKQVDFTVERSSNGARGDVSFAAPGGGQLHADYRFLAERQLLDLQLAVDGVNPATLPPLVPELMQLRHVAAPVSGNLQTRIDVAAGRPEGSRLDLVLGSGSVRSEWLPNGEAAVDGGELHATYAPERNEIDIAGLTLSLGGGTRLSVTGRLSGVTPALFGADPEARPAGRVIGEVATQLKHLSAARLAELWPAAFATDGRRWVLANVHDGMLDAAKAQLTLDLDPVSHLAGIRSAAGTLAYRDLTITYFKGLPPVRNVDGSGIFAHNQLTFTPNGGTLKGIKVTGGSIRLTDLDAHVPALAIDLTLTGPLEDALDVLDTKPLRFVHTIGLDPAGIGGRADTQLQFKLPLRKDLKLDEIDYGAEVAITDASIAKIALDRDLSAGTFALDINRAGSHLQGSARFSGIPTTIDADLPFHTAGSATPNFNIGMTLDREALGRLGIDVDAERMSGSLALRAKLGGSAAKGDAATATLDLRDAALTVAEAGWQKPAGQPGTVKLLVDLNGDHLSGLRSVDVAAPGIAGHLSAQFGGGGEHLDRIDLHRLIIAENNISGAVVRSPDGGWRADIHAARIDARPLFKELAKSVAAPSPSPPLSIEARIDRLVLGPQRALQQVSAELGRSSGIWRTGRIQGRFANEHKISLSVGDSDGDRLALQSDDLGATLKLLGIADNVVGGQLTMDGQLSDSNSGRTLAAHIEGSDYRVTQASPLARMLALPSLTGLASALSGAGLWFGTLRGDVAYTAGQVRIERLLASGEALGITASGWYDTDRDAIDLQGTVAPAYLVNSLVGGLPLVGPLLGGGSQGLFAANYRASGPTANPQVIVNPLSALTPGILRDIFAPLVGVPK